MYLPTRSVILQVNSSGADLLNEIRSIGIMPDKENLQFLDTLSDLELLSEDPSEQALSGNLHELECKSDYDFKTLTLFLTERCNLGCVYCYANGGTGRKTMDFVMVSSAIEFMADHCEKANLEFHLAFHGAGEPTLPEELLRKCIGRSEQLATQKNLRLRFSIGTNGVMSDSCRKMLVENEFDISLSIDGPEAVHNATRPLSNGNSFQEAMKTAELFSQNGLSFSVRATVTDQNLNKLPEFSTFIFDNTTCEILQLEPVYATGRAFDNNIKPPEIDQFINQFFICRDIADQRNRLVAYSGISYPETRNSFCQAHGASLCVKPDGSLTGCYESASKQPEEDPFHFGFLENGLMRIDQNRYRTIRERPLSNNKCESCFARQHCGGDCPSKIMGSSGESDYRCALNRKLLEEYLLQHLDASGQNCIKFN